MPQSKSFLDALNAAEVTALTLWSTAKGYQANALLEKGGGWKVTIEPTASEALLALLGQLGQKAAVPPPPPALPLPPY